MDDATFELFKQYLMVRMQILKLPQEKIIDLIKLDWLVFSDIPAMQQTVDRFELSRSIAFRDNQDLKRPALDAHIEELEAKEIPALPAAAEEPAES